MRYVLRAAVVVTLLAPLASGARASARFVGFRYDGIVCEADTAVGSLLCARGDGVGYGVGLTPSAVIAATHPHHVVFFRKNTGQSAAAAIPGRTLFVFNRLRCRVHPVGTVFCAREDNGGFGIAISRAAVSVIRMSTMTPVFTRRN